MDASNDRSFVEHLPAPPELGAGLTRVRITSGDTEVHEGDEARVSRVRLISAVRSLIGFRRLHIPEALDGREELVDELQGIEETITAAANVQFRTRPGMNDDLVMALALALNVGERLPAERQTLRVHETPLSRALGRRRR